MSKTFRAIWQNLKKTSALAKRKELFIGSDHLGNKYFEKPADLENGLKRARRMEAPGVKEFKDVWDIPKLPIEWQSWLQGRREDPPTDEELLQNYISNKRTLEKARELDMMRQDEDLESDFQKGQEANTKPRVDFPKMDDLESYPGEFEERGKKS